MKHDVEVATLFVGFTCAFDHYHFVFDLLKKVNTS